MSRPSAGVVWHSLRPPLPVRRERPGEGSRGWLDQMERPPREPSPQPSPGVPGEGVKGERPCDALVLRWRRAVAVAFTFARRMRGLGAVFEPFLEFIPRQRSVFVRIGAVEQFIR